MKRAVLLPLLVTLLLTLSASAARAAPFTLTMIDITGGTTVTVTDNGTGDLSSTLNQLLLSPAGLTVGNFKVTGSATIPTGTSSVPIDMTLPISFKVTSNSATGGTFEAILSGSASTALLAGPTGQAAVKSSVGAVSGGASSVSFTSWVDPTNSAFSKTPQAGAVQLLSTGNNVTVVSDPFAVGASVSLYSKLDFVFAGTGSVNAATDLQVINPVATPEPSTMLLFLSGAGLLGLALFARRRSKKGTHQLFPERGVVMMKKTALLPLLVALLLWISAAPAQAGFVLTLSDTNHGVTQTINDGDVTDLSTGVDDVIVAMGDIGDFNATINTGAITYGGLFPISMDLTSFLVTNNGTTGGDFRATLLRTGLDSSLIGSFAQGQLVQNFTTDIGTIATAVFTSSIAGTAIPNSGVMNGDPSTLTGGASGLIALGSTFSMFSQLDIHFSNGNGSSASGASELQAFAPVATPEPGTMSLFGLGLGMFGLVSIGRARSKKA